MTFNGLSDLTSWLATSVTGHYRIVCPVAFIPGALVSVPVGLRMVCIPSAYLWVVYFNMCCVDHVGLGMATCIFVADGGVP